MTDKMKLRLLPGLVCAILGAVYVATPLAHLDAYAWDYDEGPQLQAAALADAGYPLYSEIVLNKPPLLTWILQLAFRVGGTDVPTARLAVLSVTFIGLIAFGLLVGQWWGRWAAPMAMLLIVILPETPARAIAVMNDLPAMSASIVSFAAVTRFARSQRWVWLVVGGVAYAASLGFHPILAPLLIPIATVLLMHPASVPERTPRWPAVLALVLVVAAAVLPVLLVVDRHGLWQWVVEYNAAPAVLDRPISTLSWSSVLTSYLGSHWPLVGMAVVGSAMLAASGSRSEVQTTAVWLIATALALAAARVPRAHNFVFISCPLAALGAGGIASVVQSLLNHRAERLRIRVWWLLATVVLAVLAAALLVKCVTARPVWPEWTADQRATRDLASQSDAAPFLVTDDQFLAFAAGRLVPPSLADTSFKRIEAGYLSSEQVVGAIVQHGVRLVVIGTDRLARLPGFIPWLVRTGALQQRDGDYRTYEFDLPSTPDIAMNAQLGDTIEFLGYTLSQTDTVRAGDVLTVTLFWRSSERVDGDFTVFVHLTDEDGRLVWQHDGMPLFDGYPTSAWVPGIVVPDPHPVHLDGDVRAGAIDISAGMYQWPSLERLVAFRGDGSPWPEDRIVLTTLRLCSE